MAGWSKSGSSGDGTPWLKSTSRDCRILWFYKINYLYDHVPMVSLIITNDTENMSSYLRQLLEKLPIQIMKFYCLHASRIK